ncbi:trifunctional transcriptional regulator/proline dehydrogenase/pyrroline-5-carboxylate dehydrogenase [Salmonella enterica subsp. enterica serovar Typhimurium]|nr:trifunctional transcriptional regulator/proline dehydrogenase/pyrroline-5-carboxylate dehydrogenase [Salmonella enterica subsp. enterica serovar Typhimurium]
MAMRLMGEQFVTGETIAQALANAENWKRKGSAILTICWAKPR